MARVAEETLFSHMTGINCGAYRVAKVQERSDTIISSIDVYNPNI